MNSARPELDPDLTTQRQFSLMAVFFNVLSYGENMYKNVYEQGTSHAEENAIRKLQPLPRKSRLKKVDMLVIRTNREGLLGSSKPCANCVRLMANKLPEKGYTLNRVYYSETGGGISCTSFHRLMHDGDCHVSRFYKGRRENNLPQMLG